jgi:predicted transcriptional regulator
MVLVTCYHLLMEQAPPVRTRKLPVSVSLSDDDKALLGMVARAENRSRSAVVRRAVRSYADEKGIDHDHTEH